MVGHLSILGFSVSLYDIFQEIIDSINSQGGIKVEGKVEGLDKLKVATTDIADALGLKVESIFQVYKRQYKVE